ncbi:MAG: hypothetical protein M3Y19_09965 [Actinomycetota bacterium]|nr:hypothetical protein [Actinomycetota bacterium]
MPDTNVLVAAAITPRGLWGRLVDAAIDGRWQMVVSPQLLLDPSLALVILCPSPHQRRGASTSQ